MNFCKNKLSWALGAALCGCLSAVAHADSMQTVAVGHPGTRVKAGQRLLLTNGITTIGDGDTVVLAGGTLELAGGNVINRGTIVALAGTHSIIDAAGRGEVSNVGTGRISVQRGATLTITGSGTKIFSGGLFDNQGIIEWGKSGRGAIRGAAGLRVENHKGAIIQLPGVPFNAASPAAQAAFMASAPRASDMRIHNAGVIRGAGVIYGSIINDGDMQAMPCTAEPADEGGLGTPTPESGLVMVIGSLSTSSGTLTTTLEYVTTPAPTEYYGQFAIAFPMTLSGPTLNVTFSPATGHTFAGAYYIISCPGVNNNLIGISGTGFGTYTGQASHFQHNAVPVMQFNYPLTGTMNRKAYEIYGYTP